MAKEKKGDEKTKGRHRRPNIRPIRGVSLTWAIYIVVYLAVIFCLQCLDTVGWALGRASSLQK